MRAREDARSRARAWFELPPDDVSGNFRVPSARGASAPTFWRLPAGRGAVLGCRWRSDLLEMSLSLLGGPVREAQKRSPCSREPHSWRPDGARRSQEVPSSAPCGASSPVRWRFFAPGERHGFGQEAPSAPVEAPSPVEDALPWRSRPRFCAPEGAIDLQQSAIARRQGVISQARGASPG